VRRNKAKRERRRIADEAAERDASRYVRTVIKRLTDTVDRPPSSLSTAVVTVQIPSGGPKISQPPKPGRSSRLASLRHAKP